MKLILKQSLLGLLLALAMFAIVENSVANSDHKNMDWVLEDTAENIEIQLYFFWSENCPHCTKVRPILEKMGEELPWLRLHSLPISQPDNRTLFIEMASTQKN